KVWSAGAVRREEQPAVSRPTPPTPSTRPSNAARVMRYLWTTPVLLVPIAVAVALGGASVAGAVYGGYAWSGALLGPAGHVGAARAQGAKRRRGAPARPGDAVPAPRPPADTSAGQPAAAGSAGAGRPATLGSASSAPPTLTPPVPSPVSTTSGAAVAAQVAA